MSLELFTSVLLFTADSPSAGWLPFSGKTIIPKFNYCTLNTKLCVYCTQDNRIHMCAYVVSLCVWM